MLTHSQSRLIGAAILGVMAVTGAASANEHATPACSIAASTLDQTLPRTRARLNAGDAVTIVAIGSSSTEGAGASSDSASYPSRLEVLLAARFPGSDIRVLNRGVGGEEEADMLARFDRDVIAERPDLVLWQVGSNAVMRDRSLPSQEELIQNGILRLKETGADVVLIDPQYTTAVLAHSVAAPMVDLISVAARRHHVGAFRRFALMRAWREKERIPFESFSIADGLHMNDWGYDCFARNLSAAIIDIVAPSMIAASAGRQGRSIR